MSKTKKITLTACLALLVVTMIVLLVVMGTFKAKALVFTGDLTTEHKSIADGNYSHALVISGKDAGKTAGISETVYGDFSVRFGFPNTDSGRALKVLRFDFVAGDGRAFSVGYMQTTEFTGFYVETAGNKGGIYYGPNVLTYTSEMNAQGRYTAVTGTGDLGFRLDVETMSIYASCGESERLVWCFSQLYNDGKTLDTLFDSFNDYRVSVCLENIEHGKEAQVYLYAVNGQSYTDSKLSDNAAPALFALADTQPVLNRPYTLPVPGVYDVIDGNIASDKVQVSVLTPSNNVDNFAYTAGKTYVFDELGTYKVTYTVADAASHSASYAFALKPIHPGNIKTDFTYDYDLSGENIGVGAVIRLPEATVTSTLSNLLCDVKAQISVTRDGNAVSIRDGAFVADQAGVYTVVYSAVYHTATLTETHTVEAKEGLAVLSDVNLKTVYRYQAEIAIPDATITFGGTAYPASKVIVAPSGKAYANTNIALTEEGTYTVSYSAVTSAGNYLFEKTFRVVKSGADLFTDVNGKSTFYEGRVHFYEQASGVMLSMSQGAEVWYNNIIDLSNAGKSDFFVTYYIVPSVTGSADFGGLRFFLVDAYDESNYVEIYSKDSGAVNTGGIGSYNQASTRGQLLGYGYETSESLDTSSAIDRGMTTLAGFRGTPFSTNTKAALEGGWAIDYKTKQLFPMTDYAFSITGGHPYLYQLTDLDNPNFYATPWEGFTTGECYLKIVPEQVGARANVLITSVGGISLAQNTAPASYAPTVTLDEYENGLPDGVVGMPYPLPAYIARSKFFGDVYSDCHVYLEVSGKRSEINIRDGAFTPDRAGDYTIVITAQNPDGISVTKTYTLTVKESAPTLGIRATDIEKVLSGKMGSLLNVAGYSVTGCLGNPKVKMTVTSPDGTVTEIGQDFTPNKSGVWTVTYTVTDYLGRTAKDTYTVTVSAPEKPVPISLPTVPDGFVKGYTYYLPLATALDYSADEANPETVTATVYVTDASGRQQLPADGKYIPNVAAHGDPITVEYVFIGKNGQSEKMTYSARGLIVTNDKGLVIANYFVGLNITGTEATPEYTKFAFSSDASLIFSRPLLASGLKTVFNVDPDFNNYDTIRVTLVDSENAAEVITFTITKKTDKDQNSSFALNGGITKNTRGSFFGNSSDSFVYTYSATTRSIADASGYAIDNVTTTANGSAFSGFSSGKVYIRFDFEGVTGESKFMLNSLSGQAIGNATTDRVAPSVALRRGVAGIHELGSVIDLAGVMATDVLSEIASATVTVTCGDQTILAECSAFEAHQITLSSYGRYFVTYKVKDTAGRTYTEEEILYVRSNNPTAVAADADIPGTASVGDKLTLPTATVTGGAGEKAYYILVMTPDSRLYRLEGNELVLDQAGTWVIRYFAYDAYFNCSYIDYTVIVK